eukprot:COSAG02_NODE_27359_length_611_cov_1.339844_1_plen_59_part_10
MPHHDAALLQHPPPPSGARQRALGTALQRAFAFDNTNPSSTRLSDDLALGVTLDVLALL